MSTTAYSPYPTVAYGSYQLAYSGSGVGYNKAAEWYMTFCMGLLMVEGTFTTWISKYIGSSTYIFTRITGYAPWPSEVFFLGIGLLAGVIIYFAGRAGGVRTYGVWAYLFLWVLHLAQAVHGRFQGYPFWYPDLRYMWLAAIVVPWVAVLGQKIRYEVVLGRIIKLSVPLACVSIVRGVAFMGAGVEYTRGWEDTAVEAGILYQADMVLLLAYLAALSRGLVGTWRGTLSVLILAAGIIAPLNKISIAAFLFTTPFAIFLAAWAGRSQGLVRLHRVGLRVALIAVGLAVVGTGLLTFNQGAGERFLRQRVFKENQYGTRDYSTGRFDIWMEAISQWKGSPIYGLGMGSRLYQLKSGHWLVYHNQYLRYLAQMGTIGFAIVAGAFVLWLRRALRTLRWERSPTRLWTRVALISYVCALAFACLYTEALSAMCISYTFWMCIALEAAAHSQMLAGAVQAAAPVYYQPTYPGGVVGYEPR